LCCGQYDNVRGEKVTQGKLRKQTNQEEKVGMRKGTLLTFAGLPGTRSRDGTKTKDKKKKGRKVKTQPKQEDAPDRKKSIPDDCEFGFLLRKSVPKRKGRFGEMRGKRRGVHHKDRPGIKGESSKPYSEKGRGSEERGEGRSW